MVERTRALDPREVEMAVASVSKITAASTESFDAAVREGLQRAGKTLRGITGLHIVAEGERERRKDR